MTQTDVMLEELKRAGLFDADSDYSGMVGDAVRELLLTFQAQEHSGHSAQLVAELFHRLVRGDVLSPLTADPSEWLEVSDALYQSRRCHHVFWDGVGKPWTIDGKAFSDDGGQTWFTNSESHVAFDLPGYPPKTERVIL